MFDDENTLGSLIENAKTGFVEVSHYPKNLYDLYNENPNMRSIMRQIFFYSYSYFFTIFILKSLYSEDNAKDNQDDLGSFTTMAGLFFAFTYHLILSMNYDSEAINKNQPLKYKPCKHTHCLDIVDVRRIRHHKLSYELPLLLTLGRFHINLFSHLPYISIPAGILACEVQMALFEFSKQIDQNECPREAYEALKSKNGFLLAKGAIYYSLMQLINSTIPSPFNIMFELLLYHGFSIATLFSDKETPKDNINFNFMSSSEVILQYIRKLITWYNEGAKPSDILEKTTRVLFLSLKKLNPLLPLEPNWYNLPFHQALGNYRSAINQAESWVLSPILSVALYFLSILIDDKALGEYLTDLKETLKDYKQDYKGDNDLVSYLSAKDNVNPFTPVPFYKLSQDQEIKDTSKGIQNSCCLQ